MGGGGGGRSEKLSRRQRIANCLCCRRPKPPPEPEAETAAGKREKSLMGESCTDLWSPNSVMLVQEGELEAPLEEEHNTYLSDARQ